MFLGGKGNVFFFFFFACRLFVSGTYAQEMFKGSELQFDNNKARNISSLIPCQPKK